MHVDGRHGAFGHGGKQKNTKNMHKWARRTIFGNAWPWQKIRLTLGLPKNQTEAVINIILGGQGLQRALI